MVSEKLFLQHVPLHFVTRRHMLQNVPDSIRFSKNFRRSSLIVAKHCYGAKGIWAHKVFDYISERYFGGRLPYPHIIWGLTPHGGCVAWASTISDNSRPPIITLHPSLLRGSEKENPWGITREWLGPAMVFDTILHECIHIHINCNLGGRMGSSSHNCKRWIRQVNRIAPLLGFQGVHMGISKAMRVPIEPPKFTKRGKRVTRVVRGYFGNVPFTVGAGFPGSFRSYFGRAGDYYGNNHLPPGAPRFPA
jgi:hypothetical protein